MAENSFVNLSIENQETDSDKSLGLLKDTDIIYDITIESSNNLLPKNKSSRCEDTEISFSTVFNNCEKNTDCIKDFVATRINKLCEKTSLKIDKTLKKGCRKSLSLVDLNTSNWTEEFLNTPLKFEKIIETQKINNPCIQVESTSSNINTNHEYEGLHVPISNANTTLRRASSFNSVSGIILKRELWVDDAGDDLFTMVPCWDDSIPSEDEVDDWGLPALKLTPKKKLPDQFIIKACKKKLSEISSFQKDYKDSNRTEILSSTYDKEPEMLDNPTVKLNICQEQILEPLQPLTIVSKKPEVLTKQKGPMKARAPIQNMVKNPSTSKIIEVLPQKRPRRSGSLPRNMNSTLHDSFDEAIPVGASTPLVSNKIFGLSRRDDPKTLKVGRSMSDDKNMHINSFISSQNELNKSNDSPSQNSNKTFEIEKNSSPKQNLTFEIVKNSSANKNLTYEIDNKSSPKQNITYEIDNKSSPKQNITFEIDKKSSPKQNLTFKSENNPLPKQNLTFEIDKNLSPKQNSFECNNLSPKQNLTFEIDKNSKPNQNFTLDINRISAQNPTVTLENDKNPQHTKKTCETKIILSEHKNFTLENHKQQIPKQYINLSSNQNLTLVNKKKPLPRQKLTFEIVNNPTLNQSVINETNKLCSNQDLTCKKFSHQNLPNDAIKRPLSRQNFTSRKLVSTSSVNGKASDRGQLLNINSNSNISIPSKKQPFKENLLKHSKLVPISSKQAKPIVISNSSNTKCQKTVQQPAVLKDSTFSSIANSSVTVATTNVRTSKLPLKIPSKLK